MSAPRRASNFGCLGLFCVFCLIGLSSCEVAALRWLNPDWYDRLAFWRGPIIPPEEVWVAEESPAQAATRVESAQPPARRGPLVAPLVTAQAVQTDYQPARGASLVTPNGGRFEFPAGSVREPARIRATPVAWAPGQALGGNLGLAGDCYMLHVGEQEHYRFNRPVRVTLKCFSPFAKDARTARELALCVQEGDGWRALPSSVDPVQGTVSADVPHCSVLAVGAVLGLIYAVFNGRSQMAVDITFQELQHRLGFLFSYCYKTDHFSLRYSGQDKYRVPPAEGLPGAGKLLAVPLVPEHPQFVYLMGEYLEYSFQHLALVGMVPENPHIYNNQVYFLPLDELVAVHAQGAMDPRGAGTGAGGG
jgi:hypothetical protein